MNCNYITIYLAKSILWNLLLKVLQYILIKYILHFLFLNVSIQYTSTHCAKNNLNLRIKTYFVNKSNSLFLVSGPDTVYTVCKNNHTYTVASNPTVPGEDSDYCIFGTVYIAFIFGTVYSTLFPSMFKTVFPEFNSLHISRNSTKYFILQE